MMKLSIRDVLSYQGRDWVVEGMATFKLGGRVFPLACVVDGDDVRYVEPLLDASDDRILFLAEAPDLEVATPPAPTIHYKGHSYLPRLQGTAQVAAQGKTGGREAGACELWRYRAAGDLFIQIEKWPDRVLKLAGESVHKGMVEVLPAT